MESLEFYKNKAEEISSGDKIDLLEEAMNSCQPVDCPLNHRFTPGLYTREIFMPAGALITSMIHKTTHPFFILKGKVSVFSDNDGEQILEAPYVGITKPGTRRVLYIHEDCVWATAHPTDVVPVDNTEESILNAVWLVEAAIIEPHINPLLGGTIKNNVVTKNIDHA